MHYQDKTFCGATNCSKFGKDCPRSYTPEVHARAVKWWGSDDAPVCKFSNPEGLECYDAIKMDK